MSNLGWTCPTCKTNWAPSVLKCDCGPALSQAQGVAAERAGAAVTMPNSAAAAKVYAWGKEISEGLASELASVTMDQSAWTVDHGARTASIQIRQYGPGGTA
jgi:hypothetical protein